jgi:hypothetical protein
MQELSILPGHLRSPPFLVGFVLCDLLCLGSVLWIMVCTGIYIYMLNVQPFSKATMGSTMIATSKERKYHH